mmetsp:Transcript_15973/g.23930  ORF Transcript_15973/g.23930 Transcript_15973/m.23930 type:complete len:213 (+) Transcript_15973:603-1241(+)
MVGALTMSSFGKDPTGIFHNGLGIDGGGYRTSRVDFRHDLFHVLIDHTIFRHSGIGKVINFGTFAPHTTKGIAGTTDIRFFTSRIHKGTKSILTLLRTGNVRLARIIRCISRFLNELVNTRVITSMARSGNVSSAIKNVLDGEVDIVSQATTGDFNTVGEGRHGTMGPARSAVLGQVLVEAMGEVGFAIDVGPGEGIGEVDANLGQVGVGKR